MTRLVFLTAIVLVVFAPGNSRGDPHQDADRAMSVSLFPLKDLKWTDAPPSLPRGAKIAVLEGDPSKEGPFVFRASLPDGYRIPPHTHPKVERITVISGTFNVGMGEKFDASKSQAMPAGTFGFWPAGMKHFVWAKGETVIQFHGMGPWSIQYVNSDDDPRTPKRWSAGRPTTASVRTIEAMTVESLPHLETFVEAAERGSFTAAARVLRVSQAAISQRVQQLEQSIGVPLFRREAGRISLSEAGQTLHEYARRILALHREARTAVGDVRPTVAGDLILGASSIPGDHLLPGVLGAFRKRHPHVRVRVEGGDTTSVIRMVERGVVHIGLVGGKKDSPHLVFNEFARDRLVVVVRPTHPWRRRRRVSLTDLARQPLILREGGSGSRSFLERAIAASAKPVVLNIALELGSNEAVKEAVSEGVGVAVLSQLAVQRDVEAGHLHALEITGVVVDRPMFIVTDRRRALPPVALAFLAQLGK